MGIGAAVQAVQTVAQLANIAYTFYPPLAEASSKKAWSSNPNKALQIVDLVSQRHRGLINDNQYIGFMEEIGISRDNSFNIFESSKQLLTAGDYAALFRREEMTEPEFEENLVKLGFDKRQKNLILAATQFYPTPADLIRFAVREVYSDATAKRFGLFEGIPPKFLEESSKVGLSEDSAKLFWAAHWELPSLSQGYEMFHRRIIDRDTLLQLMTAQDVMPFWRDKLMQKSYHPLTRVDVRRMYGFGVLS